ncbi:hypothetical protein ABW19_dt0205345 [Dactylella cylindrospora]|nr:hypothetical protein ABW19_dt0205345 [Dactylella cylindrospora]
MAPLPSFGAQIYALSKISPPISPSSNLHDDMIIPMSAYDEEELKILDNLALLLVRKPGIDRAAMAWHRTSSQMTFYFAKDPPMNDGDLEDLKRVIETAFKFRAALSPGEKKVFFREVHCPPASETEINGTPLEIINAALGKSGQDAITSSELLEKLSFQNAEEKPDGKLRCVVHPEVRLFHIMVEKAYRSNFKDKILKVNIGRSNNDCYLCESYFESFQLYHDGTKLDRLLRGIDDAASRGIVDSAGAADNDSYVPEHRQLKVNFTRPRDNSRLRVNAGWQFPADVLHDVKSDVEEEIKRQIGRIYSTARPPLVAARVRIKRTNTSKPVWGMCREDFLSKLALGDDD